MLGARFTLLDEVEHDIPGIERHLAEDTRLGRRTVVDIVHSTASAAVRKEAMRASRLRDPRLARIVATGRETVDGSAVTYVATEHVPGAVLSDVLARRRVDPRRAVAIVGGAARALAAGRAAGLTHGFVRPSCITVTSRGRVVVAGLGVDGEAAAQAGLVTAPSEADDARALALLLVRALTGMDPEESTPDDLPDGLAPAARDLAVRALRGAPPATVGAVVDALVAADSRALIGFDGAVAGLPLTPRLEREAAEQAEREAAEEERRREEEHAAARALVEAETLDAARTAVDEDRASQLADNDIHDSVREALDEIAAEEAATQELAMAAALAAEQERAIAEGRAVPPPPEAADRHEAAFDTLEIMVAEQNLVREQGTWELVLSALHRRWPRSEGIARSLRRAEERANRGGPLNGSRVVLTVAIAGLVLAVMIALTWLASPLAPDIVIEEDPSGIPNPAVTATLSPAADPSS
ncbi:hypothetical protein [Demequina rhizosphaerae]|uniref:hypothetical protein n=1 Tax=Demequina rhizosphaerae TaxID=1638985 RepID=UPI000785376B|nr:hypothetical protein [Demequina rhizosphaerae]